MSLRPGGWASRRSTRGSARSSPAWAGRSGWAGRSDWDRRSSGLKPTGASAEFSRVKRVQGDRGDVVLGWLTKLAVVLGLFGLIAFDGIAVVQAHFQASD